MNIKAEAAPPPLPQQEKLQPSDYICITCNRQHIGGGIYCLISTSVAVNIRWFISRPGLCPNITRNCSANSAKTASGMSFCCFWGLCSGLTGLSGQLSCWRLSASITDRGSLSLFFFFVFFPQTQTCRKPRHAIREWLLFVQLYIQSHSSGWMWSLLCFSWRERPFPSNYGVCLLKDLGSSCPLLLYRSQS